MSDHSMQPPMQQPTQHSQLSTQLGRALMKRKLMLATAESCTGGGVAEAITAIAGSSAWYEAGFVTYSNVAKQMLLGVPRQCFEGPTAPGAVSEETALAMAVGALEKTGASCSIATTGIAGPNGGSKEKPVGTVWIAWAWKDADGVVESEASRFGFPGDRGAVRSHTVEAALDRMLTLVDNM
jgi:nicotinamide-nucleotide amidase